MTDAKIALLHIVRHPLVIAALLALSVSLAILTSAAALIWAPARMEAAAAEEGFEKAAAALRELRYRARLAEDFAALRTQVETLETKLRQARPEPEFVRDIEALAGRTGASVAQFSTHSAEENAGVSTTYFEFFLNGSYANLRQFISELPELNEFVAIERVSLERNGGAVRAYLILKRRQKTGLDGWPTKEG